MPWASLQETHTAALFFAGDRVYKVKKPVRLEFVDLSTLSARHAACMSEVELNRRLSPDVYLGVAEIRLGDDALDHAVVMRRLPDDATLAARIVADDPLVGDYVDRIADLVARFHDRCDVVGRQLPESLWTPPVELVRTEVARTAALRCPQASPERLDAVRVLAEHYADGRVELFDRRRHAGLVRDGHGDLSPEDIFMLSDGPRVLDCLEFDQRLRVADVLHDVAFLAMHVELLGRPDLARRLVAGYQQVSGETHPATLEHFFVAHRALIRAKVAAIRAQQLGAPTCSETDRLLELCERHLQQAQVRVVVVGGLPGAGKTTLAEELAAATGAVRLSTDRVRYELVGGGDRQSFEHGRYAPQVTDEVYETLIRDAADAVRLGEHVVLDASWSNAGHRQAARRLAAALSARCVEIEVRVGDSVAAERLGRRRHAPGASEADADVRMRMRERFDAWPEATVISGSAAIAESVATLTGAFERTGGGMGRGRSSLSAPGSLRQSGEAQEDA